MDHDSAGNIFNFAVLTQTWNAYYNPQMNEVALSLQAIGNSLDRFPGGHFSIADIRVIRRRSRLSQFSKLWGIWYSRGA
jgi:hypothetical protein